MAAIKSLTYTLTASLFVLLACSSDAQTSQHQNIKSKANARLEKIHSDILTKYPNMSHISHEAFSSLKTNADIVILDVRAAKEYAVSHIEDAIRIDPNITREAFDTQYGDQISGKHIVLYCSVGHRSSRLGERLLPYLDDKGVRSVANLQGGIFRWHNESLPLHHARQPTDYVHPYNPIWSRYVARKDKMAYKPEPNP